MGINFLYNLVFASIIQGLFFSIFILFSKKHRNSSSKYLGLLILSITLSTLQYTAEELDWISWHNFNLIFIPYLFLIPALLYFFISGYLHPDRKRTKIELLLFLPFVVFLIITLCYKVITIQTGETYLNNNLQRKLSDFIDYEGDFILIPIILLVIVLLFRKITVFQKQKSKPQQKVTVTELLWIKLFLSILLVSLVPWYYYTYQYWKNDSLDYLPMYLLTAFVIYAFGYIGIHKINILNQRKKIRSYMQDSRSFSIVEKTKNPHISNLEKLIIDNTGYLDPNLSLESVANEIGLSKSYLSRIINAELQTNFNDYVNSFRVAEAQNLLLNPQFSNYTLVSIGLEAGFNSKTTFNTVFKKQTGLTPSQYRKNRAN